MAEYIQGINPTIIKWARERSGYTLQEVAKSFNIVIRGRKLTVCATFI